METKFHSTLHPLESVDKLHGAWSPAGEGEEKKKKETNVATGKPHHVENARGIEKGWDAVLCIFSKLMRNTGY